MLYKLGPLSIKVAPFNVHEVSHDAATDYVDKPVIGAAQPMEYVGEGASTWTLTGQLLPKKLGGLQELEVLQSMRASGMPQYLMRGDGRAMGWVAITSVNDVSTYLDRNGVGKVIKVTINCKRCGGPSVGSFFSLMAGLF